MCQSVRPSVRPYVRMSTKSYSDFHLIWCVGRPRPLMRTSVTSTRSKVKVKVTELPKLRKVHFSRSISSAILAWSSKLTVDVDSIGPGLQPVEARFSNFFLGITITTVHTSQNVDISRHSNGHIFDLDAIKGQCQSHGLLNFRKLAKPCMLAAMTAAPLRGFLVNCRTRQTFRTASLCHILSESIKPRPRYCDFSIFKGGDCRHLGFSKFQILNGRTAQEGQSASP